MGCINDAAGFHRNNRYFRVFDLTEFEITGDFAATRIDVGIERAVSRDGNPQVAMVQLHTLAGSTLVENFKLLAETQTLIPNSSRTIHTVASPVRFGYPVVQHCWCGSRDIDSGLPAG
ncbi:MAG: hypothetical protein MJE77_06105 [Proteobacteria bacterium]|nr:hypothetical protein [Pseudomonadota bacterium]